ncbi:MAG: Ig domain-containing protein [Muribaculaceae bacterium]|nr:Ig domain-containing protein [Muribaculaceae bacterium]
MITFPTTPPICGTNSFTLKTKTKTVLYVPKGSYAAYWSAPVWQDFKNIVEIDQVATSISLPESLDLTLNNTIKLDATFAPINTTITSLIWESSNPEVAIVDQEGNVTAVANGKATITATTIDGSELSASCEVKIGIQDVESITLSQKTAEIKPKDMLNLTCVVSPDNATEKTISWTSDNTSVAVVRTNSDGSATVLAVAPGIANITAATNDGTNLSDTCEVKVLKLAESITLDKTTASVNTDNIIDITATILPDDADYKNVTWSISNETLATIKTNENGSVSVSAINPGVVTVTATTVDGSNLSASCEITITKLAESIALDKEKISMVTGHEETLVATVLPDNTSNKSVAWTLSDATLATLKDNGDGTASITAINPGIVNVTVTTTDGTELFASCEITIIQLATSINLDKETISIEEGKSEILAATVMPDNTSNKIVEWSSSDESIATVVDNNDGTAAITVHKKGVATITATTTDGSNLSATCEVSGLSGILGIEVDCIGKKRYDIHGRLLSKPSPGLNIIIKNDGTTRKEIIK